MKKQISVRVNEARPSTPPLTALLSVGSPHPHTPDRRPSSKQGGGLAPATIFRQPQKVEVPRSLVMQWAQESFPGWATTDEGERAYRSTLWNNLWIQMADATKPGREEKQNLTTRLGVLYVFILYCKEKMGVTIVPDFHVIDLLEEQEGQPIRDRFLKMFQDGLPDNTHTGHSPDAWSELRSARMNAKTQTISSEYDLVYCLCLRESGLAKEKEEPEEFKRFKTWFETNFGIIEKQVLSKKSQTLADELKLQKTELKWQDLVYSGLIPLQIETILHRLSVRSPGNLVALQSLRAICETGYSDRVPELGATTPAKLAAEFTQARKKETAHSVLTFLKALDLSTHSPLTIIDFLLMGFEAAKTVGDLTGVTEKTQWFFSRPGFTIPNEHAAQCARLALEYLNAPQSASVYRKPILIHALTRIQDACTEATEGQIIELKRLFTKLLEATSVDEKKDPEIIKKYTQTLQKMISIAGTIDGKPLHPPLEPDFQTAFKTFSGLSMPDLRAGYECLKQYLTCEIEGLESSDPFFIKIKEELALQIGTAITAYLRDTPGQSQIHTVYLSLLYLEAFSQCTRLTLNSTVLGALARAACHYLDSYAPVTTLPKELPLVKEVFEKIARILVSTSPANDFSRPEFCQDFKTVVSAAIALQSTPSKDSATSTSLMARKAVVPTLSSSPQEASAPPKPPSPVPIFTEAVRKELTEKMQVLVSALLEHVSVEDLKTLENFMKTHSLLSAIRAGSIVFMNKISFVHRANIEELLGTRADYPATPPAPLLGKIATFEKKYGIESKAQFLWIYRLIRIESSLKNEWVDSPFQQAKQGLAHDLDNLQQLFRLLSHTDPSDFLEFLNADLVQDRLRLLNLTRLDFHKMVADHLMLIKEQCNLRRELKEPEENVKAMVRKTLGYYVAIAKEIAAKQHLVLAGAISGPPEPPVQLGKKSTGLKDKKKSEGSPKAPRPEGQALGSFMTECARILRSQDA